MYLMSPSSQWQARPGFSGLGAVRRLRSAHPRRARLRGFGLGQGDTDFEIPSDLPLDTSSIDTTSFEEMPVSSDFYGAINAPIAPTATNYPTITPPAIASTTSPIASLFSMTSPTA